MSDGTAVAIEEKARAGYPAIYLVSSEYVRSLHEIKQVCDKAGRTLFIWTLSKGLVKDGTDKIIGDTDGPANALDEMSKTKGGIPEKSIVVMPLLHHYLEDPGIQAKLIDLLQNFKSSKRMLVIVSPVVKLPIEIEKEFALVEMQLPDKVELKAVLNGILKGSHLKGDLIPDEAREKLLLDSALGLTTSEAENAFSLSLVRSKDKKEKWDPTVVMEEKCSTLKKTGLLTYYPPGSQGMKQVGGMANLKEWISKRRRAFTDEAKKFGLPPPKGILTVGPPGSGKSLGAKAISEELGLPLLRCDMGRIFAGLVGASEENARRVIQTAEAVSPCVLWLDEIEKGFAGAGGSGNLDSGVGSRVLGTFLTWMQEKTTSVFVYATANNVSALPPELLRKGRFDETFSVMLPSAVERLEIFNIHLSKRNKVLKDTKMEDLVKESDGFSGAEIEAAINEAMFTAFSNNRQLSGADIIMALDETQPLSVTMKEQIQRMEEWCEGRTRSANVKVKTEISSKATSGGRSVEA
jgi:SpoVK/Ycf46/Vps4 family AAA+-type ATPase